MRFVSMICSAVLGLALLCVGFVLPDEARSVAAVAVPSVLTAAAAVLWPLLARVHLTLVTTALLAAAGAAAVATAAVAADPDRLRWWPVVVAVGVLVSFVFQLLRGHEATHRVDGIAASTIGVLLVTSPAGWVLWMDQAVDPSEQHRTWAWTVAAVVVAVALLVAVVALVRPGRGWGSDALPDAGGRVVAPAWAWAGGAAVAVAAAGVPVELITRPLLG